MSDDFKNLSNEQLVQTYVEVEEKIKTVTEKSNRTNLLFFSQCLRDEMKRRKLTDDLSNRMKGNK